MMKDLAMDLARQTAQNLLAIGAVFLRPNQPFVWASGIKSPIYCDNRLVLSAPDVRTSVAQGLAQIIRANYPSCETIAGTATAGIAHAALVANNLCLPMCYVRGSAKSHGRNNQIEGSVAPGQKVVVIEDLISTGGSVLDVVQTLRDAGCQVLGIASIFTYGMAAGVAKLQQAKVQNVSLSNYDVLLEEAVKENYIKTEDLPRLQAFRQNPQDAGWMLL